MEKQAALEAERGRAARFLYMVVLYMAPKTETGRASEQRTT